MNRKRRGSQGVAGGGSISPPVQSRQRRNKSHMISLSRKQRRASPDSDEINVSPAPKERSYSRKSRIEGRKIRKAREDKISFSEPMERLSLRESWEDIDQVPDDSIPNSRTKRRVSRAAQDLLRNDIAAPSRSLGFGVVSAGGSIPIESTISQVGEFSSEPSPRDQKRLRTRYLVGGMQSKTSGPKKSISSPYPPFPGPQGSSYMARSSPDEIRSKSDNIQGLSIGTIDLPGFENSAPVLEGEGESTGGFLDPIMVKIVTDIEYSTPRGSDQVESLEALKKLMEFHLLQRNLSLGLHPKAGISEEEEESDSEPVVKTKIDSVARIKEFLSEANKTLEKTKNEFGIV